MKYSMLSNQMISGMMCAIPRLVNLMVGLEKI